MSFIRPGQGRKKRAFVRKRPQWDDSVNDLDSYRATPEEIRQRREAHKSKNHITVKLEKMRKEKQKQRAGLSNVEARQVAIMKEVLHDQQQLDNVLTKTDHMLAVVKDLFGDDSKKFTGHPNVTLMPGSGQSLPAAPEIRTRIEKLSESMMSQSALNDLSGSSEGDSEEEEEGEGVGEGQHRNPVSFQPLLDLQRFQQFVWEEENRNSNAVPTAASLSHADVQRLQQLQQILLAGAGSGQGVADNNHTLSTISGHPAASRLQLGPHSQGPAHSTQVLEPPGVQTPPNSERADSTGRPTPIRSALNDTGKVKKSRRKVQPPSPAQGNSSSLTMTDMRQVLECLHAEIADFEQRTGRRSDKQVQSSETFTGYTVSLVTAVTKLTHYMKETELRLQAEMMVREQLAQDVRQLTVTIDSLTQEMIVTQEEYGKMANEFHRYRQQAQGEMALLQAQVLELKQQQSAQGSNHSTPGKAASAGSEAGEDNYSALPDHVTQPSAAVLLSPVVRKTRVPDDNQPEASKPKRQTSLIDIPSLVENDRRQQQQQQQQQQQSATSISSVPSTMTHSDPPRLTQTLPVMATVSVPRPIPLVQSNVGLPLSASQVAGPPAQPTSTSTGLSASAGTTYSREATQAMNKQIAVLGRQNVDAQHRLVSMLEQQKLQQEQLKLFNDNGGRIEGGGVQQAGGKSLVVQEGTVPSSVSPPISPISHHSEHFNQLDPIQRLARMSREIKVSMPVMDLDVSAGSLNTSH
ncbi:spindle and centriole-associated protein 1-like isoform X2 [Babylonia areolata]|uniref:spindle and centriole-associated protein 1-like isoform X2 n=1 Tax=Babylonia areolata TaxID=304850 RepID=UPI003FD6629E